MRGSAGAAAGTPKADPIVSLTGPHSGRPVYVNLMTGKAGFSRSQVKRVAQTARSAKQAAAAAARKQRQEVGNRTAGLRQQQEQEAEKRRKALAAAAKGAEEACQALRAGKAREGFVRLPHGTPAQHAVAMQTAEGQGFLAAEVGAGEHHHVVVYTEATPPPEVREAEEEEARLEEEARRLRASGR